MAPLTKSSDIPNSDNPYVPEHVLDHMILPRLPFKALKLFECVSKRYRSLIGHDPLFPSDQARLLSPSSTDIVQMSSNGLSFMINPESIGVPDPSLKFIGNLPSNLMLLCSTNGLLLFYSFYVEFQKQLCLCNPATQEKVFVPSTQNLHMFNIGLAFDPCITPNRYILVSAYSDYATGWGRYSFSFHIFRSDTGEWSRSNKKVHENEPLNCHKIVHTQGVIYWYCCEFILWYNTEKDLAGSIPLPTTEGDWSMGVYAGEVVCCHTWPSGVEVWRLTYGTHWDRLHCIRWDSLPLQLNHTWLKIELRLFRPLAFDGQFVYLLDYQNQGEYNEMLTYNICTPQLEKKGLRFVSRIMHDDLAYDYHNSMAPLPKILQ